VAWLELSRQTLRLRVEDAAARYPVVVDPFVLEAALTASDAAPQAGVGNSVSISDDGSTIAVGAPFASIESNGGGPTGAAYIFVKQPGGWTSSSQTATLTASDGTPVNFFGDAVGVSNDGNTIVVGAYQASNFEPGAAYVFVKPAGGWTSSTETAKLTASDAGSQDGLGYSVSISGDGSTIAAGEIERNLGPNNEEGAVYIFAKPSAGWISATQTAKLRALDGQMGQLFGWSVSLSNDGAVLAVGAPNASNNSNPDGDTGALYVFVGAGRFRRPCLIGHCDWTQAAKLTAAGGAFSDELGASVGVSSDGSIIAAGAPFANNAQHAQGGAAYVFDEPTSGWTTATETDKLIQSDGIVDALGYSIGVSGDGRTIAVGTGQTDLGFLSDKPGADYVFVRGGSGRCFPVRLCLVQWRQTQKLTAPDGPEGEEDTFGNATGISTDGSTIVVGAPGGSSGAQGAAYVFGPFVSINPFPPFALLP
jgi:hypothetical protein